MNKEKRVSQFGRSMIEMLGVLAIIGVLSVGGIAGYTKAMEKYKINQTIDEVNSVISNVQTTFYGKHERLYCSNESGSVGCPGLRAAGIAPDEMWTSGNRMKLSHFGRLSIDVSDNIFRVTLDGLSKTACVTLATLDWNRNDRGLIAVNAKGCGDGDYCDVDACYATNGQRTCWNSDGWAAVCAKDAPMPMTTAVRGCTCTDSDCQIILGFKI
ncbi:MAG: type II secretion system GspH family protein [Alphaproteobacteria bacterium]|nr:type II secretion system GspH family protein [Alphaproteobacteria bacterium]